ncbi:MAG TPA: L,D-transpeptidase family protein [Kiloniellales bacterium]|nr:L,D-transpeptidase family protein [Kiloniellales bacterium]
MDLIVEPDGALWRARCGKQIWRCAVGRAGVRPDKREGDGATPAGAWPLRSGFYRADRIARPESKLSFEPISPEAGWCDDPADPAYNRLVTRPHPGRHEALWRDDGLYDLVVVLGYNDAPPVPGHGSAIFLHVARPDWGPTEGCVALALPDLLSYLTLIRPESRVRIETA